MRRTEERDGNEQERELRDGWRFLLEKTHDHDPASWDPSAGDRSGPSNPDFDDSDWDEVTVPHDWAIAGPFDAKHDVQRTTIFADGERTERVHVGRTGGLPHAGIGWYRYAFEHGVAEAGERELDVELDGVMSHAEVYCNGVRVAGRPYGYASFSCRLTPHVRAGRNVLAVRVDNPPFSSRWYPGAGIYRRVRLVTTDRVRIPQWGLLVRPELREERGARLYVEARVENRGGEEVRADVVFSVLDAGGESVGEAAAGVIVAAHGETAATAAIVVAEPHRWDPEDPYLYTLRADVSLAAGNITVAVRSAATVRFGIRSIEFDPDDGLRVNDRPTKLRGVCMHHDLGPLGAAVNRDARQRQLALLQEMGCNAVRTSHNPPEPELLDLCDEMGFLVIDEAFDEWRIGKVDNGYHLDFDEWAESDLHDMIVRDRNHPCVIMWSTGNEIPEQKVPSGAEVARFLSGIVRETDPTRPTTSGMNLIDRAIEHGFVEEVDIVGLNYEAHRYTELRRRFPGWIIYGSETESCVSSRGTYFFPVEEEWDRKRDSLDVTSYDVAAPHWGYPPDIELEAQRADASILGSFVWTGWDYLGEPTPYKTEWPSRSSYFGIVDLAGIPKDRFFLYQAAWTQEPVLHLLPHWTWPGREGELTPVHCYTNCHTVELVVNGRSHGVRRLRPKSVAERRRLIWTDVRYEPGEVVAIGRDASGAEIRRETVRTAGSPARIALYPERAELRAHDEAMAFVRIVIEDEHETRCPAAEHAVQVTVEGDADLAAICSGDQTSLETFRENPRRVFHGEAVIYLRARTGGSGRVRLKATAAGLRDGETALDYVAGPL